MAWYLKGETGEPLDDTLRTLESLRIDSAAVRFQSLAEDTLTWSAATDDAAGTGTIIPRIGQVVELWKDSARAFRGHAVAPRVGMERITITVQGPWWWLDRIPLTQSIADATGVSAERASHVFPTGSLQTNLETLIDAAIALGAPIRRGTVAAMYDVPHMTIAGQSCAAALATMLQWCPDSVAWYDYSDTTGNALPHLHISRRGGLSTTTLTIGADAVEIAELSPRLDLEVSRAELAYVTRQPTTGKPAWASQAAGTAATGKRQIITLSGPEITDHLPRDDFQSQEIQTSEVKMLVAEMYAFDAAIAAAIALGYTHGFGGIYNGYGYGLFTNAPAIPCNYSTGWHRVIFGEAPRWMETDTGRDGAGALKPGVKSGVFTVSGWAYFEYDPGVGIGNLVNYLKSQNRAFSGTFSGHYIYAVRLDYTIPVIDTSYATKTTVYSAWDYDFFNPPAGLAAALVAAQNWVPWEGHVTTVADDCTGANLLAAKYNLVGTIPDCASMAALARGCTHDLMRGRTTIELGAPARMDFGTLVSRIRRSPQDNIVNL